MGLIQSLALWFYENYGPNYEGFDIIVHPGAMRDATTGQFKRVSSRQFANYLGIKLDDKDGVCLLDELPPNKRREKTQRFLEDCVNLWPTNDKEIIDAMKLYVKNRYH